MQDLPPRLEPEVHEQAKGCIVANENMITVIGNLVSDPELKFVPSGSAVASFTIASTPRVFDRHSQEWKDQEPLFLRASVWREQAENVAESLTKGTKVIAVGKLKSRSYETKEGEKRTVIELEIDEIAPSLRNATAKVTRTQRGNQQGSWSPAPQQASQQWQQPAQDDPWATPQQGGVPF